MLGERGPTNKQGYYIRSLYAVKSDSINNLDADFTKTTSPSTLKFGTTYPPSYNVHAIPLTESQHRWNP